jgi:hypothetical protein
MLSETLPFEGLEGVQIALMLDKGMRPSIPCDAPQGLANLIRRCWVQDPHARPSFAEIAALIASGDVYFPGADRSRVQSAIARLRKLSGPSLQFQPQVHLPLQKSEFGSRSVSRSSSNSSSTAVGGPPEAEPKKPEPHKAKKTPQGARLLRRRSVADFHDDDRQAKVAGLDIGRLSAWAADGLWV